VIDKFISVHIHKTAGSSFFEIIRNNCHKKFIMDDHDVFWYLFTDASQYEEYDIIHGHFTVEKYMYLNRPQVTIMREPVERVISEYFWIKKMIKGNFQEMSIAPHFEEEEGFKNIYNYAEYRPNVQYNYMKDTSNFDWIGIKEYFNKSMHDFFRWFGADVPDNISKVYRRKNNQKDLIINKPREYIKRFNLLDYELYTDVLNRYEN